MPESRSWSKAKLIVIIIVLLVVIVLVLQNTEEVKTRILLADVTMPRAVLLLVTGGMGFIAGLLVAGFRKAKKKE